LFGSAATGSWDPETSDFDLLIDLGEYEAGVTYRYLDFADELEILPGRHVDLVTTGGLRRRSRLRDEIERSKVQLYMARDTEAVA
jgi:predicted nucleotidyltransferase